MCSEGEHVTETHAWDAQSAEYEAQEPEWVAEAAAYCGKDDAWDESSPQDCGELDELFGSLDTAKASATTELGNASQVTSAARHVMDAGKLVAQVKSARGFFPGVGGLPGFQWHEHFQEKEREFLCQNLVLLKNEKENVMPDDRPQQSVARLPVVPREEELHMEAKKTMNRPSVILACLFLWCTIGRRHCPPNLEHIFKRWMWTKRAQRFGCPWACWDCIFLVAVFLQ